jgi:hypothetical protein
VLLGGVVALLPVYAHEVLQVGPQGLGLLRSSMAAGEVCMGLWLASRPINRRVGKVMFAAVAVFGLANLVFALSHWFGCPCWHWPWPVQPIWSASISAAHWCSFPRPTICAAA